MFSNREPVSKTLIEELRRHSLSQLEEAVLLDLDKVRDPIGSSTSNWLVYALLLQLGLIIIYSYEYT